MRVLRGCKGKILGTEGMHQRNSWDKTVMMVVVRADQEALRRGYILGISYGELEDKEE